jgi:Listeria-Bacteroides repeat domain (List_Bact_rpt)
MGNSNVTLYAQWKLIPMYAVTYDGNNYSGGSVPRDAGTYAQGATVTDASTGDMVRSGYNFTGWNTSANGSGTARNAGSTTNILAVKNVTGGAWGISCIVTFENGQQDTVRWPTEFKPSVRFNAGEGSGIMDDQPFTPGESFRLNACTFTRTGYRFTGWCGDADCSLGAGLGDQVTFTFNNEFVYLTANWIAE